VTDDDTPHIEVTLDGTKHQIRMDQITARQVMLVQDAFAVTPASFMLMVKAEAAAQKAEMPSGTVIGLPQLAALVYLARLQAEGRKVDVEAIKDSVTLGAETKINLLREFEPSEVATLDPPA